MNQIKSLLALRKKTNNILHFILCIVTLGFWVWVWLYLLISAASHNESIARQTELLVAAGENVNSRN